MNALKIGAIALLLIIACPIILGYAMASDEVEYTKTTESESAAITDMLLNSESDYFINYSKLNNNSTMMQRVTAQGDTYYVYESPDYVSTGANYTSLPAYETESNDTTYSSSEILNTYTHNLTAQASNYMIGFAIGSTPDWAGCGNYSGVYGHGDHYAPYTMYFSIDSTRATYVFIDGLVDTDYTYAEPENAGGILASSVAVVDLGDGLYSFTVGSTQYTGEWAYIGCFAGGTGTISTYEFMTLSPSSDVWTFSADNVARAKLTYSDGTVENIPLLTNIANTPMFTLINGEEVVNEVSSVAVSFVGSGVLTYFTQSYTEYANPAYGWYNAEAPALTNPVYYNAWFNQYQNATVMMYVAFNGNGQTTFYEDFDMISPVVDIKRINGAVTLTDSDSSITNLGTYQYLQVVFNTIDDNVTISGITKMPSMGEIPQTYNSVIIDYDFDGYIEQLVMVDQYSTIVPATADYYLDNGESQTITFEYPNHTVIGYILRDSDGLAVTSGWSAVTDADNTYVTFTAISLETGLYTLYKNSLQGGSETYTIYIGDVSTFTTSPIAYRVDSATIVAGDYPSTVDYTLDIYSLYPNDTTQIIYLNSIGVYGDSLTVAGNSYTVTDNSITITDIDSGDSVTVKLLKSTIKMVKDDDTYETYINGYHVADRVAAPTIYFGGEWSLTATRSTVVEETAVKSVWTPGEFALDTDGFVLAMLLTAVGAFVVLGMTGARSGAKVGLLALICGGAAAVGLMIL